MIGMIANAVDGILDKFISDADKRLEAKNLIITQLQQLNLAQLEVNKAEAAHKSLFVAGWRPFIGWVCGSALAWNFLFYDLLSWVLAMFWPETSAPPRADLSVLMPLLMAMLGMAGMRTYEKRAGVSREK